MSHSTLRLVLTIIVHNKMYTIQFDIKAAFLAATLDSKNQIYLSIPQGLERYLKKSLKGKVLRLRKSLYGLKQAPREFNKMLNKALIDMGFKPTLSDKCLYSKKTKQVWIIIAVWVDDGILASTDKDHIAITIKQLKKIFNLGQVEELNYFLGMKIRYIRERGRLTLSSERYVKELAARFNSYKTKNRSTPQEPGSKLMKPTGELADRTEFQANRSYREIVGSLLYVSITTRPDISYGVGRLSRYLNDFDQTHWKAALYLLGYLQTTKDKELIFQRKTQPGGVQISCFTDAAWADDKDTRKSTAGYLVYINDTLICWKSTREKTIALSTAEAEYLAAIMGMKAVLHIQNLLKELGIKETHKPIVWIDNTAALSILQGESNNYSKTRHMDLKAKWAKHHIIEGKMEARWINTKEQRADVMTKAVDKMTYLRHMPKLCIGSF